MLTALAFLVGFFTLLGLALARHPIYGLYAYLASFYIHPPSRWWAQNLPDLRWAFLAAGVTVLAILIHRSKLNAQRPAWYASLPGALSIGFVIWLWIQSLWALDVGVHRDASTQFTKYLVAFYFVYRLAETPERLRDILLVHVAGCTYLSVLAFYSNNYTDERLNGVGGPGIDDANTLGMFLGTGLVVAAMLALVERGWRRIAVIVAAPVILNGIVLAASRGAFLGVLAGGLVLFLVKPPQYRRLFWVFVAVGVIGAVSLMDQRFIDRMLSISDAVERTEEMDSSAESRWAMLEAQVRMFADHPLGTGHKGSAILSAHYLDPKWVTWVTRETGGPDAAPGRSSHNTLLTALVEQSIPGAVVYLSFVLWGMRSVLSLRRGQRAGTSAHLGYGGAAAAALAVVLAAGLFTDYLMAEVQVWMLALLVAQLKMRPVGTAATATRVSDSVPVAAGALRGAAQTSPEAPMAGRAASGS
jgi:hypothetical protein